MTREGWVQCEHCGAEYRSQTAAEGCCAEKKAGGDDDDDETAIATDGGELRPFCAVDEHVSISVVVRR